MPENSPNIKKRINRTIAVSVLAGSLAVASGTVPAAGATEKHPIPPTERKEAGNWPVIGSAQEQEQVHKSLEGLVKVKSKYFFDDFERFNGTVVRVRDNVGVEPKQRLIVINDREANPFLTTTNNTTVNTLNEQANLDVLTSFEWRQANEGNRYITWQREHPGKPVPNSVMNSQQVQNEVAKSQLELLNELGATESTVAYVKSVILHPDSQPHQSININQ